MIKEKAMSRTKRFKHDKWLIKENRLLQDFERVSGTYNWVYVNIDPTSKEARKRIAKLHSDAKKGVMRWRGPGWFVHEYHQVPYRQQARQELIKFMKDPDYEVQILRKPYLTYWW
jgi:hypothetical protein